MAKWPFDAQAHSTFFSLAIFLSTEISGPIVLIGIEMQAILFDFELFFSSNVENVCGSRLDSIGKMVLQSKFVVSMQSTNRNRPTMQR